MKILDPQWFWDNLKTEESPLWPVVCIDLNGVLDVYAGWNGFVEKCPPAEGVETFLSVIRMFFNTVIILTATMPLDSPIEWLHEHNLSQYVDYITNHKPPAQVYIDDKAVCHKGDFKETLREAVCFKPHWLNGETER
jgi:hypothetical protein